MQLQHPALLEGRGAVWLPALWADSGAVQTTDAVLSEYFWRHLVAFTLATNLEVLGLVAVAVAHVPPQFVRGEKTLRAPRELASAGEYGQSR